MWGGHRPAQGGRAPTRTLNPSPYPYPCPCPHPYPPLQVAVVGAGSAGIGVAQVISPISPLYLPYISGPYLGYAD